MNQNNNGAYISRLAKSSVRSNRLRILLIILTITISTALLAGMGLSAAGMYMNEEKQVEQMQQVMFMDMSEETLAAMEKDGRIQESLRYKRGAFTEQDDIVFFPYYVEQKECSIKNANIEEGTWPEKSNEIAVFKEFLGALQLEEKIGQEITLTFADGSSEAYMVCGFLEGEPADGTFPFLVSEEYAEAGSRMKVVSFDLLAKIDGAKSMTQDGFRSFIWEIGEAYGITKGNINPNNYFLGTLMGTMKQQEILLYVGVAFVLLLAAILVIYSIFYISVVGRIRQFGQLRTLGMTKKQIQKMVQKEGFLLSVPGILLGLLLGTSFAYLLIPEGFDFKNTAALSVIIVLVQLMAVRYSVRKPAKLAAAVSPIEASKYVAGNVEGAKATTRTLSRKITPVNLAVMNFRRNRKKAVMTLVSMGIGGVLFMCAVTFMSAVDVEEYSRQGGFKNGEFEIYFSGNAIQNAKEGITQLQLKNPMDKALISEIQKLDGVEQVFEVKGSIAQAVLGENIVTDMVKEYTPEMLLGMEGHLEEGTLDYEKLVKEDAIIICNNDYYKEVFGEAYALSDQIELTFYNGEQISRTFPVEAIVDREFGAYEERASFYISPNTAKALFDGINLNRELIIKVEPKKEAAVGENLKGILNNQPLLHMDSLAERREEDASAWQLMFGVVMGLSGMIIGFSLINLFNILITNIVSRKQEFAMLQSLGMGSKQLNRMIRWEGLLLAIFNGVITLTLGTALGYGLYLGLNNMGVDYFHYHFPGWYLLGYLVVLVVIPLVVSKIAVKSLCKESVVERLRVVD